MEDIPPELKGIPPEMAKYAQPPLGVSWIGPTTFPPGLPPAARDCMEMIYGKIGRTHTRALKLFQNHPDKFTDMPLDERDLALINAPEVPGVAYHSGLSFLLRLIRAEVGKQVSEEPEKDEELDWVRVSDQRCQNMLAEAGHVLHGFESSVTVAKPLELQQQMTGKSKSPTACPMSNTNVSIVKVQIMGCGNADFEWGVLTAMAGKGSPRGDVRIFKGPRSSRGGCDGMILRNAIATSHNLMGTSLHRVWDILLLRTDELIPPWKLCAMREVAEPGGRLVTKDVKVAGGWTRIPDAERTRDLQDVLNGPHPLDEPLDS